MAVASVDTARSGPTPSLEQVRSLAGQYNLIPVRETVIDDLQTPVSAFLKLRELESSFLLESADQGRVGRYSFIGLRPPKGLRWSLRDPRDPHRPASHPPAPRPPAPPPRL